MCEEIESTAVECGDRCDHCAQVLTALSGRCAPCMQQLGVDIKLMGQRAAAVVDIKLMGQRAAVVATGVRP
jgi:hypothetical protein